MRVVIKNKLNDRSSNELKSKMVCFVEWKFLGWSCENCWWFLNGNDYVDCWYNWLEVIWVRCIIVESNEKNIFRCYCINVFYFVNGRSIRYND